MIKYGFITPPPYLEDIDLQAQNLRHAEFAIKVRKTFPKNPSLESRLAAEDFLVQCLNYIKVGAFAEQPRKIIIVNELIARSHRVRQILSEYEAAGFTVDYVPYVPLSD